MLVLVLVLVLVPQIILIHEDEHEDDDEYDDEYEKNQIRSDRMHTPCAISYFPHSNFPPHHRPSGRRQG